MPFYEKVIIGQKKEGDAVKKITDWKLGDMDVVEGCLHCGGEELYIEILKVLFGDMPADRERLQKYRDAGDWKSYIVAVHSVKSSMASVGASPLSEMARKLEMAGKRGDTEYIMTHHDEMMSEFDRIYQILERNLFVNTAGSKTPDNGGADGTLAKDGQTDGVYYPELGDVMLKDYVNQFEEAFYELDEDKMLEILSFMRPYQRNGIPMEELLRPIIRKVEMMDYMSAYSLLEKV